MYSADLKNLQALALSMQELFRDCGGNFVISGCACTSLSGQTGNFSEGYVYIDGKVRYVEAKDEVSLSNLKIVGLERDGDSIAYGDGTYHPQYKEYYAEYENAESLDSPYIALDTSVTPAAFPNLDTFFFNHYAITKSNTASQSVSILNVVKELQAATAKVADGIWLNGQRLHIYLDDGGIVLEQVGGVSLKFGDDDKIYYKNSSADDWRVLCTVSVGDGDKCSLSFGDVNAASLNATGGSVKAGGVSVVKSVVLNNEKFTPDADGSVSLTVDKVGVDSRLDTTSSNPVQNKVVTNKLNSLQSQLDSYNAVKSVTMNGNVSLPDSNGNVNLTSSASGQVDVDSAMSSTSTNPVQNKVVNENLNSIRSSVNILDGKTVKSISVNGGSETKPDGNGNVNLVVNASGSVDSALSATSSNPVQNKVINSRINTMQSDLSALDRQAVKSVSFNGSKSTPDANGNVELSYTQSGGVPIGSILMWSGKVGSLPDGYLLCNGSIFSSTAYPKLYSVLGSAYTPNLSGRFVVGYDSADGDYNAIGKTGGEKSHILSVNEMPSHAHSFAQKVNSLSRAPGYVYGGTLDENYVCIGAGKSKQTGTGASGNYAWQMAWSSISIDNDDSNVLPSLRSWQENTGNAGGGQSHENRPPYYVLAYIIRAK